jgi:hypothetical protein
MIALIVVIVLADTPATASVSPRPGRIYAQTLIDQAVAQHPDVLVLAMHVTPPNTTDNVIIASNIGRIGKKADADDLAVIQTGKAKLEVNAPGTASRWSCRCRTSRTTRSAPWAWCFPTRRATTRPPCRRRRRRSGTSWGEGSPTSRT